MLEAQRPAGYWVKPSGGYNPKYTGTVWSFALLAQAGADKSEPRVRQTGEYVMEHTIAPVGWFSYNGTNSGFLHCHAGYIAQSLVDIGFGDDPRVTSAIELHARLVTGEGIAAMGTENDLRYYHYSPAPDFVCAANGNLPCAWGAVKGDEGTGECRSRAPYSDNEAGDRTRQESLL